MCNVGQDQDNTYMCNVGQDQDSTLYMCNVGQDQDSTYMCNVGQDQDSALYMCNVGQDQDTTYMCNVGQDQDSTLYMCNVGQDQDSTYMCNVGQDQDSTYMCNVGQDQDSTLYMCNVGQDQDSTLYKHYVWICTRVRFVRFKCTASLSIVSLVTDGNDDDTNDIERHHSWFVWLTHTAVDQPNLNKPVKMERHEKHVQYFTHSGHSWGRDSSVINSEWIKLTVIFSVSLTVINWQGREGDWSIEWTCWQAPQNAKD